MNISAYLASRFGKDSLVGKEAEVPGTWIRENHHPFVYSGSKTELMYTIASSTVSHGRKAIGIEVRQFYNEGCSFPLTFGMKISFTYQGTVFVQTVSDPDSYTLIRQKKQNPIPDRRAIRPTLFIVRYYL